MSIKPPAWDPSVPHECHDCGEVYAAGVQPTACVNDGHYVAPLAHCELPVPPVASDTSA